MRKHVGWSLILAGAMILAGPVAARAQAVDSLWTELPVKIDGLSQDWQGVAFETDKKSKAEYAFKNDGQNLYILLVFKEPQSLSTLEASGMKIYYTLDGKKKKRDGLQFLKRQLTAEQLIAELEAKGEVLNDQRRAAILSQPAYLFYEGELIDPPKEAAAEVQPGEIELPTFRNQRQQRVQFFEYRIPLQNVARVGGIGAAPGQTVTLGFEWGGMTKEMIARQMTQSAEASTRAQAGGASIEASISGGDERVEGGGMGGGMSGGMRRNPNAKKHTFWVDVKLAEGIR